MKILLPVGILIVLAGCSAFGEEPYLSLSTTEALEEGKKLLEEEKYRLAGPYLLHAFEIEPNSVQGREGLLLAADALYKGGGFSSLVKAQARYRDFLNRFPTSEHAAYAQFQIGASMAKRMEKPDRDQSLSTEALQAFRDVQRLFPTSEYAQLAGAEIGRVRDHLAKHEIGVARFYMRLLNKGYPVPAVDRLEGVLEKYPDFADTDEVLFYLCKCYRRGSLPEHQEKAEATCTQLEDDYPESPFAQKLGKKRG